MDAWFFNNIKDSLHLSICFSPLFKFFKDFLRNYPALINSCTIDWFMPWPVEALNEVAVKYVGQLDIDEERVQPIATVCAFAHSTSNDASSRMLLQLKRNFYVTPTNYIELLKGYGKILEEKRKVITTQSKKLSDGLEKLSGASSMVATMQGESDIKRQEVQRNTREVDDLLVKISGERKVADEKQVFIQGERVKIEKEAGEAEALAAEAEADLKVYEPELKAAEDAIAQLDSKSISEVKSYTTPPEPVMTVMSAVMIVLGKEPTWPTAKKMMTDSGFINTIKDYDKESTKDATVKKIEKYTREEKFRPEYVTSVSRAAGILCMWVKAVEGYAKALKTVAPKRARMQYARDQVAKKMAVLKELEDEFAKLAKRLAELEELFNTKNSELEEFSRVLNDLQTKIDRGDKLISGLAGEKLRWEATIDDLADQFEQTVGNCLLSAAFMSYCGPFPADYRQELVLAWKDMVKEEKIPHNTKYDFPTFMASEAQARAW
jgi:dynein heavy chain